MCVKGARRGSAHLFERGHVIGEESLEERERLGALQAEERAVAQREANGGRSYVAAASASARVQISREAPPQRRARPHQHGGLAESDQGPGKDLSAAILCMVEGGAKEREAALVKCASAEAPLAHFLAN